MTPRADSRSGHESDSHSSMECDQGQPVELHTHGPVQFPHTDTDTDTDTDSDSGSGSGSESESCGEDGAGSGSDRPVREGPPRLLADGGSSQEESDKDSESPSAKAGPDVMGDASGQSHAHSCSEGTVTAESGGHGNSGDRGDEMDGAVDRMSGHISVADMRVDESSQHDSSHDTAVRGDSTPATPLAPPTVQDGASVSTSAHLLTREELLQLFLDISPVRGTLAAGVVSM